MNVANLSAADLVDDKFEIIEKLGQGGMGVLYRSLDTHLDRTVAIKVLRAEAMGHPERKRRFVLEAKAASALNHPNIITIYDADQAKDSEGRLVDFMRWSRSTTARSIG